LGWQPREQQRDTSRPRYNNNQESWGERQNGQERKGRISYNGQPRAYNRGGPPRKEMMPSFFKGGRGLPGVETTGVLGKQRILGKIRGKIRGEILGKILGNMRDVIIVTTQRGVIGGLFPQ